MRPPDLPEEVDPSPLRMRPSRFLAIGAVIVAVLVLIVLATVPAVQVTRFRSVPFETTLDPNGTAAYVTILHSPTFCPPSDAVWNGTVPAFITWHVVSGRPLVSLNIEQFTPPNSPIIYWSNDTASGSFHFPAYCTFYAIGAVSTQPETVQVNLTWNYTYVATVPVL